MLPPQPYIENPPHAKLQPLNSVLAPCYCPKASTALCFSFHLKQPENHVPLADIQAFAEIPLFSNFLQQGVPQWDEMVLWNYFLVFSLPLKFLFEFSQALLARRFWNIFSKYVQIFLHCESFNSYLIKCLEEGCPAFRPHSRNQFPMIISLPIES